MSVLNLSSLQRSFVSFAGALMVATLFVSAAVGPAAPSAISAPVL